MRRPSDLFDDLKRHNGDLAGANNGTRRSTAGSKFDAVDFEGFKNGECTATDTNFEIGTLDVMS
jgi:hypothetical protein